MRWLVLALRLFSAATMILAAALLWLHDYPRATYQVALATYVWVVTATLEKATRS